MSNTCYCQILMHLIFSQQFFRKNIQIQNFMKIRQVGAELSHADEDEAYSCFSQFCERT